MADEHPSPSWHIDRPGRRIVQLILFGVPLLIAAVWFGRQLGRDWIELEKWITALGYWGPLVLIAAITILSIPLFPDTPFAMIAGALFGIGWGTLYTAIGVWLGATLVFFTSRILLQQRVRDYLEDHPRWSAVEEAASREGVRLQLLIRLTPVHSALFSYVMGASRVSYAAFAVGCLAMIPGLMVEVYCGHLAGHMAGLASGTKHHSPVQTIGTIAGLLIAILVMSYVTRLARRAIAQSEAQTDDDATADGPVGYQG